MKSPELVLIWRLPRSVYIGAIILLLFQSAQVATPGRPRRSSEPRTLEEWRDLVTWLEAEVHQSMSVVGTARA